MLRFASDDFINTLERVDLPGHDEVVAKIKRWARWREYVTLAGSMVVAFLLAAFVFNSGLKYAMLSVVAMLTIYLVAATLDRASDLPTILGVGVVLGLAVGLWREGPSALILGYAFAGLFLPIFCMLVMGIRFLVEFIATPLIFAAMTPIAASSRREISLRFPEWVSNGVILEITWRGVRFDSGGLPIYVRSKSARANGTCKERYTKSQIFNKASQTVGTSFESEMLVINPPTGLPMPGNIPAGFDVGGNLYGQQVTNPTTGLQTVAGPGSPDVGGNNWCEPPRY